MKLDENGIYAVGQFIELSREKRFDREKGVEVYADYAMITTGGRKGVFGAKFDAQSIPRDAFQVLSNAALGDDVVFKLRLSAMDNRVYYGVEDAALLPVALETANL